jgi:hypothetical protein
MKSILAYLAAASVMDSLHWRSFSAKPLATSTCNSHYCACLGHLGWHNIDRIISIHVASPKVAKASKEGRALLPVLSR